VLSDDSQEIAKGIVLFFELLMLFLKIFIGLPQTSLAFAEELKLILDGIIVSNQSCNLFLKSCDGSMSVIFGLLALVDG